MTWIRGIIQKYYGWSHPFLCLMLFAHAFVLVISIPDMQHTWSMLLVWSFAVLVSLFFVPFGRDL